jgi:hypothetical protein
LRLEQLIFGGERGVSALDIVALRARASWRDRSATSAILSSHGFGTSNREPLLPAVSG